MLFPSGRGSGRRDAELRTLLSLLLDICGDIATEFRRSAVSKARRLLGYDPTTDFRVGVKKFVEWFRDEGRGLPTDARG